ncbi:hypothetical protein [Pseudomonas sp. OV226]|uniref:hypothetical protein n=1 Tax=Pseudomonas sp. OV226 TaxID=2135588 RepID=UPI000D6B9CF8|nr:hypothetical protein [Pseudomonas sp. OV226]PWK28122.1 hypothetical protein C7534_14033 [Pseudomonas sp. OV226]
MVTVVRQVTASLDEAAAQALYEHLHSAATRVGMERLGEWRGFQSVYWFRCRQGHTVKRYLATYTAQSKLPECQPCLDRKRLQLLRSAARAAGVSLLDKRWLGEKKLHQYRCAKGHEWTRTGRTALANSDCPQCSEGKAKLTPQARVTGLKRLRQAAQRHGGECLSLKYLGTHEKHEFRCHVGHVWLVLANSILNANHWCPRCRGWPIDRVIWQEEGLARLRTAALKQGGECLAEEYTGANTNYWFRCAQKHEWQTRGERVMSGMWCKPCSHEAQRLGIDEARRTAEERGGQCLSTTYRNCWQKLHWLCHRGHSWRSAFTNIRSGSWCPTCGHMSKVSGRKSKAHLRYQSLAR